jgi:hypothetical protein
LIFLFGFTCADLEKEIKCVFQKKKNRELLGAGGMTDVFGANKLMTRWRNDQMYL